jgi:hypothetical protein
METQGVYFEELVDACHEVFAEHDFVRSGARGTRLMYEKPGSTLDFLAWGGLTTDEKLMVRAAVTIHELGVDAFEVDCQPYIVTNAGGHMEEARKVSRLQSGKYQKILDEVKRRVETNRLDFGQGWDRSSLD